MHCKLLRKKQGSSDPERWISRCYDEHCRLEARRVRKVLTKSGFNDLKNMIHRAKLQERCTLEGIMLHEENQHKCNYLKEVIKLNKNLGTSAAHEHEETVDSTSFFLKKQHYAKKTLNFGTVQLCAC